MTEPRTKICRFWIKPISITLVVLLVLVYSGLKVKDLILGPELQIYSPLDGSQAKSDLVTVRGQAKRINQIFINGRKIFTDETGNFAEPFLLANGYNVLEVWATDQLGRETKKQVQLNFQEKI